MAAPASSNDFLELVRKSGVADEKRLDAHLQKLRASGSLPNEPGKTAGVLVRDGLLTHFQAEQILQGKWRRFTIGKYKVLERLGSGGMGSVYLCEHKLMRRRVAVKVLPTAKAADASSLERFYREARAAAALDHPNIVHAYDIDQDEALHFIVMEYVDGANFQEIVKKSGPLEPQRAAYYIHQAALGLEHAHHSGLIHRDIKPGNVLVDRSGTVKILDMGLARFFNDEDDLLTKKYDETVLGTADYLAPEQAIDSHNVDIRADIYSLGATFYFLLTGRTLFGEATVAQKLIWHGTRRPRPISEYRNDVPAEMLAVLEKMMAKDPPNRYQTPAEVIAALAPWVHGPIAPPSERELPQLSPAVTGITPGMEPTQVNLQTAGVPPSGPRRNWQVTGSPSTKPPSSASKQAVAPAASTQPLSGPRQQNLAPGEYTGGTAAASAVTQPLSGPRAQPAVPVATPSEEDDVAWERVTSDTEDPTAQADTSPAPERRPSLSGRRSAVHTHAAPETRRFWLLAMVTSVVLLIFLIAAGFFFGWFASLLGGRAAPTHQTLRVSRQEGATDVYRSIHQALGNARPGDRIVLLDAEHREQLRLEGARRKDLQIEAADGVTVTWKLPAQGGRREQPLLDLVNMPGLRIKGITFDGEKRVEKLVRLSGNCPGLTLEDVKLTGFTRSGLSVANCAGDASNPVQFLHLVAVEPGNAADCAVLFSALPTMQPTKNAHIQMQDCEFKGAYRSSAVKFLQPPGPGVEFTNVTPAVKPPAPK